MSAVPMFKKAVKYDAKGRVAIIGPSGSGKSFTSLTLATKLANGGKIAAIDTEHGSMSKYADLFDFDHVEPDSYTVESWLQYLTYAEQNNYAVFLTDSLSHYWMGKDGALEFVDMAAKRSSSRDGMSGWKEFRPHERAMIDRMIASPCHIICTMRTKTEYVESVNERGKKERKKIGLAPVQRDGMEYEFDLVAYMDDENNFIVEKTRCPLYSKKAITQPKAKDFDAFTEWLHGAKREIVDLPPPPVDIATRRIAEEKAKMPPDPGILGSRDSFIAAINKAGRPQINIVLRNSADQLGKKHGAYAKVILASALAQLKVNNSSELDTDGARVLAINLFDEMLKEEQPKPEVPPEVREIWKQMTGISETVKMFQYLKEVLGRHIGIATAETEYRGVLSSHGVMHSNEFKGADGNEKARSAARQLWELIASAEKDAEGITDADIPS